MLSDSISPWLCTRMLSEPSIIISSAAWTALEEGKTKFREKARHSSKMLIHADSHTAWSCVVSYFTEEETLLRLKGQTLRYVFE